MRMMVRAGLKDLAGDQMEDLHVRRAQEDLKLCGLHRRSLDRMQDGLDLDNNTAQNAELASLSSFSALVSRHFN